MFFVCVCMLVCLCVCLCVFVCFVFVFLCVCVCMCVHVSVFDSRRYSTHLDLDCNKLDLISVIQVVAVDPMAINLAYIKRSLEKNLLWDTERVKLIHSAVR